MKPIEAVKSLIIALLVMSMLVLTVQIIALESTGDSHSVDTSASSLLAGLGLDFINDLFRDDTERVLTDFDASLILYPTYAGVSRGGSCQVTADKESAIAVMRSISPLIAGALTLENEVFEGNFSSLCHGNGLFLSFGGNIPADLFVRLFGVSGALPFNPDMSFKFVFVNQLGLYFHCDGQTYFCALQNSDWQRSSEGLALVSATYADDIFDGALGMYPSRSTYFSGYTPTNDVYNSRQGTFDAVAINEIVSLFGFNYSSPNRNTDQNGTLTYASNSASVSIGKDSRLRFYSTRAGGGIALADYVAGTPDTGFSQKAVCAAAMKFLSEFDEYMGDVRLASAYYIKESGEFVLCFDFVLDGKRVALSNGANAAEFTYKNGYFTDISLSFTAFTEYPVAYDMCLPADFFEILSRENIKYFEIYYNLTDSLYYPQYSFKN